MISLREVRYNLITKFLGLSTAEDRNFQISRQFVHLNKKSYINFSGMRGGCSSIFKRLATANNEAANFNYDSRCEKSSIFYTVSTYIIYI